MSIELASDRIDGARAERTIAFLHGILGRGNNLRTIAKRFVEARPDWTAWLVDLRGHGRSPKRTPNPSVEAAAQDVVELTARAEPPLGAIVGHSFGGKIALEAARLGLMGDSMESLTPQSVDKSSRRSHGRVERLPAGGARASPTGRSHQEMDGPLVSRYLTLLEHVVMIDSVPGSREPVRTNDSALEVIETIESLPRTFASKTAFVEALVAKGRPLELAQWLAQSVEKDGDSMRFMLDLDEMRALILDYFTRDLWPVVEHPPGAASIHLVIGDRSDSYIAADRERAARIAASNPRVTVDVLPAGHWVHVDDPDGLLRTLLDRIRPIVTMK